MEKLRVILLMEGDIPFIKKILIRFQMMKMVDKSNVILMDNYVGDKGNSKI